MEVTVDQNVAGGGLGSQIGSAITSKLKESIQNMDVIGLLHNLVAATPKDAESEEVRQKLQNVIKLYTDMSEEEKEQFTSQLKEALVTKLQRQVKETPIDFSGLDEAISREIMFTLALYGFGALLLFALIVFFGYKLYKSIKDKEKKREDKKKAKQMKKKK